MPPTTDDYPGLAQLQHGDILLPRRIDVQAIASPVEQLQLWWAAWATASIATVGSSQPRFDLVAYWPTLLSYLQKVADQTLTILGMLIAVRKDLGVNFDAEDLAQAIVGKQYVGHCAIVDKPTSRSEPWVIESSHTHGGIRSVRYNEWRSAREEINALVWLYRINVLADDDRDSDAAKDARQGQRIRFVDTAHRFRMQGVRYAIFDSAKTGAKFSLDGDFRPAGDPTYLYCSELVLRCASEALDHLDLKERPDGYESGINPLFPMFTPKDIMLSKHAVAINTPRGQVFTVTV